MLFIVGLHLSFARTVLSLFTPYLLLFLGGLFSVQCLALDNMLPPEKKRTPASSVVEVGAIHHPNHLHVPVRFDSVSELFSYIDTLNDDNLTILKVVGTYLLDNPNIKFDEKVSLFQLSVDKQLALGDTEGALTSLTKLQQILAEYGASEQVDATDEAAPILATKYHTSTSPGLSLPIIQHDIYVQRAKIYRQQNDYYQAINQLSQAHQWAMQQQLLRLGIESAQNLSLWYLELGMSIEAKRWMQTAKKLVLGQGESVQLAAFYLYQSDWFEQNGESFLAQQAAKRMVNMAQQLTLYNLKLQGQLRLVDLYLKAGKHLHAEPLLQQTFDEAQQRRDRAAQFQILTYIVDLQLYRGKFALAKKYWQMAASLKRYNYISVNQGGFEQRMLWQQVKIAINQQNWSSALGALSALSDSEEVTWHMTQIAVAAQQAGWDDGYNSVMARLQALLERVESRQRQAIQRLAWFQQQHLAAQLRDTQQALSQLNQQYEDDTELLTSLNSAKSKQMSIVLVLLVVVVAVWFLQRFTVRQNQQWRYDSLTGLPDISALQRFFKRAQITPTTSCLLVCDIDNFKQFNVEHGTAEGDEILLAAVQALQSLLPDSCHLGRIGADRFYVVAHGFNRSQGKILADRIRMQLHKCDASIQSNINAITASVVVLEAKPGIDVYRLLADAEALMAKSKQEAQDKTVVF